jgi:hypothetical protein
MKLNGRALQSNGYTHSVIFLAAAPARHVRANYEIGTSSFVSKIVTFEDSSEDESSTVADFARFTEYDLALITYSLL